VYGIRANSETQKNFYDECRLTGGVGDGFGSGMGLSTLRPAETGQTKNRQRVSGFGVAGDVEEVKTAIVGLNLPPFWFNNRIW